MRIKVNEESQSVRFCLKNKLILESEEVMPDIICDFAGDDSVVGIEILRFRGKTPDSIKNLDSHLSLKDKDTLPFISAWLTTENRKEM